LEKALRKSKRIRKNGSLKMLSDHKHANIKQENLETHLNLGKCIRHIAIRKK
jgi:hypothetical protein